MTSDEGLSPEGAAAYGSLIERLQKTGSNKAERPRTVAPGVRQSDNGRMTDSLTRRELDANLATIEARMDGRLARIEDRFSSIDRRLEGIESSLREQKNTAWKAAGATIAITIATIIAAAALSFSAFDSGRETATMAAEARQETAAALSEIRQIVSDLKAADPPLPKSPQQ